MGHAPGSPLLLAAIAAALPAQDPRVEVVFAADAAASKLPAVAWACSAVLPMRREWPDGLDPTSSFVVRLDADGLTVTPNEVPIPDGVLVFGSIDFGDGHTALCTCREDGVEDWFVPSRSTPPPRALALLRRLRAADLDRVHAIDASVAAGHLCGASPHDPDLEQLQLGSSLCGTVTWEAWKTDENVRVRGRSDGGLLLPALLVYLADHLGNGAPGTMPMRAFAARDGDREEAVRQLARAHENDLETLRSMLFGPDETRLCAIDSLVQRGAVDELVRIVEAASPDHPMTNVAVRDAVTALWPSASDEVRSRAREILAHSPVYDLRTLDLAGAGDDAPGERTEKPGLRPLQLGLGLLVLFVGLLGLWMRERAKLHAFA